MLGQYEFGPAVPAGGIRGRAANLGAIHELVLGKVDLSKGPLSYQSPEAIVSDILQIFIRELAVWGSLSELAP